MRVRVYVGLDPLSGKRHYLTETVPAAPKAAKEAEKVRTRLLAEVDERRNPRTNATVNQLLERYLSVLEIEDTTRSGYERLIRIYLRPLLGDLAIGRIDGETLDAFYAHLRRCRARCVRRAQVDHRTESEHECDKRCRRHVCKPLGASYLRQIHTVLNGAFTRAVRWRWIGTNPVRQAEAPPQPPPDSQPPSPTQAAQIVGSAWNDPDWGMFAWLAMTTGARRGELCALRWDRIDFSTSVIDIRTTVAQVNTVTWEKDTKTHQRRRIVADPQTLALLQAYLQHAARTASSLGIELAEDSFVFSGAPDHSTWLKPDTVTQRYSRMCRRLGWDVHIHSCATTRQRNSSRPGSTSAPSRVGSGTVAAERRRYASIAPGLPRPTSVPPARWRPGCRCSRWQRQTVTARRPSPWRRSTSPTATAHTARSRPTCAPRSGAARSDQAQSCQPSRDCRRSTRSPKKLPTARWRYSARLARSPFLGVGALL